MFFLILSFSSKGQHWSFTPTHQQARTSILSFKIKEGTALLSEDKSPPSLYIQHLSATLNALLQEQPNTLNTFAKQSDKLLNQLKKTEGETPYKKFYQAECHLQSAFVHLKHGEDFTAAWEIRKAYRLITDAKEEHPDFIPLNKTLGLLHVLIGLIPEKYDWVISLMGMNGTIPQGIKELNMVASSNTVFAEEASIILLVVDSYVQQNTQQAVNQFEALYTANQDNLFYQYLYAMLLMKDAQGEAALTTLNQAITLMGNSDYTPIPFLYYLKAQVLLEKGENKASIIQFEEFLTVHKGSNFRKDAYFKMGLNYWVLNEKDHALICIEKAKKEGNEFTEADRYAASQLKKELTNPAIIQLRFATDGGYYQQAERIVNAERRLNLESKKEKVEFCYRKARYYHKVGKMKLAIAMYKLTIETSDDKSWYFAPNSALQLGYMYQKSKENTLAKKYFEIALKYKDYQYKNSIDNKAKSALSTL